MNYTPYAYGQMFPNYKTSIPTPSILSVEPTPVQFDSIFLIPDNRVNAYRKILQVVSIEAENSMLYASLIDVVSSDEEKAIISSIRADEIRHFNLFKKLYLEISGKTLPEPIKNDQFIAPQTYCEGLKRAIFEKQNAIIHYREILYSAQTRVYLNIIAEVITDIIRHGHFYNYLYTKNGCNN